MEIRTRGSFVFALELQLGVTLDSEAVVGGVAGTVWGLFYLPYIKKFHLCFPPYLFTAKFNVAGSLEFCGLFFIITFIFP